MKENKVKPISFDDFEKQYEKHIPDFVIEAVNKLLLKSWDGSSATITQNSIINAMIRPQEYSEMPTSEFRRMIFDEHWLDFENLYRENGWDVYYDKPGYNETYDAYFVFKKKGSQLPWRR